MLAGLWRESNRVGQDISQGVGPYDYRATDQSDLCEGSSGGAGLVIKLLLEQVAMRDTLVSKLLHPPP